MRRKVGIWAVGVTIFVVFGFLNTAYAQYASSTRACGVANPLSSRSEGSSASGKGAAKANLEFIPSVCVAERYDSNVFYSSPQPGLERDDLVTTVSPSLQINHDGEYATGTLELGGFSETYAFHTRLNYLGTADTVRLNLDKSIKRLLPNAGLTIYDGVRYSPNPPGFINPAAGTSPSDPANDQTNFAQGLLAFRTNMLTNNLTVTPYYSVNQRTSLNASYAYSIMRFLSPSSSNASLFNTTYHTGSVGGRYQWSALDTVSLAYLHGESEFAPASSSSASARTFKTDTVNLVWSHSLTKFLTAEVGGGGIIIDPGITTYSANASLLLNLEKHQATLSYARMAAPSYISAGVVVVSNLFSFTAVQKLSRQWQLAESANYNNSSGGSGLTAVNYKTYSVAANLYYWITNVWSIAGSLEYAKFEQSSGAFSTHFGRGVAALSLKATF